MTRQVSKVISKDKIHYPMSTIVMNEAMSLTGTKPVTTVRSTEDIGKLYGKREKGSEE